MLVRLIFFRGTCPPLLPKVQVKDWITNTQIKGAITAVL